jgi:hypothetical protein
MTDAQAIALGRFCGMAEFARQCPEYAFSGEHYKKQLIDILEQYERTKHETDSQRISKRAEAILSGIKKQPESAL